MVVSLNMSRATFSTNAFPETLVQSYLLVKDVQSYLLSKNVLSYLLSKDEQSKDIQSYLFPKDV